MSNIPQPDNSDHLIAGRYILQDEVGRGAMGVVYRGLDQQTGQPVAIKMLAGEQVAANPQLVERFIREGEALRQNRTQTVWEFSKQVSI